MRQHHSRLRISGAVVGGGLGLLIALLGMLGAVGCGGTRPMIGLPGLWLLALPWWMAVGALAIHPYGRTVRGGFLALQALHVLPLALVVTDAWDEVGWWCLFLPHLLGQVAVWRLFSVGR